MLRSTYKTDFDKSLYNNLNPSQYIVYMAYPQFATPIPEEGVTNCGRVPGRLPQFATPPPLPCPSPPSPAPIPAPVGGGEG